MKKRKKIPNESLKYFSIVLNVRGGENIDWSKMKKNKMVEKMEKLKFPTPQNLAVFLREFEGIRVNSNIEKSAIRRFKFRNYKGQLEQGSENNRPHYNLAVETTSKTSSSVIARELALALYGVKNCFSIQVDPAHNIDSLQDYCIKLETRLMLPATLYYPPSVDTRLSSFLEDLETNKHLKKFMTIPVCFNGLLSR